MSRLTFAVLCGLTWAVTPKRLRSWLWRLPAAIVLAVAFLACCVAEDVISRAVRLNDRRRNAR